MIRLRFLPALTILFLLFAEIPLHAQYKKHGRNVVRDSAGGLAIGRTKNYKREGRWLEVYPNGNIAHEGSYHLGLPEGRHTWYWVTEGCKEIAEYKHGVLNGIYVAYDQHIDTAKYCYYLDGALNGYYYEHDTANLDVFMSGTYVAGQRTGTWEYGNSDSLVTCEYVNGQKHGAFRLEQRSHDITEGFYKHGIPDSVWRVYAGGELIHEYWLSNKKKYKTEKLFFYQSDTVDCETRYRAPGEPSMFILNYRSGTPAKTEWYTGVFVDSIVQFYPDGKLMSKNTYGKNRFTGASPLRVSCALDTSGQELFRKYCYTDGSDSVRYDYNDKGVLVRKTVYDHGSLRSSYYYYSSGKLKLQISSDTLLAYSSNGKRLRTGSKEYAQLFLQIDSLDEQYASIQLVADLHAPQSPVSISGPKDTTDVTYIGYDEPYRRNSNGLLVPEAEPAVLYADVMPEFPGQIELYLMEHIHYPDNEREMEIQGTVYVRFVVERDGTVTGVQVLKGVPGGPGLSAEAIRVVTWMPKWKPATQNGRPVRCIMTLPIKFKLK